MFGKLHQPANIWRISCVSTMGHPCCFRIFSQPSAFRTTGTDFYLLHTSHASAPAIGGPPPEACFLQLVYQVCPPFLQPHGRAPHAHNRRNETIHLPPPFLRWKRTSFGRFSPVLPLPGPPHAIVRCNAVVMLPSRQHCWFCSGRFCCSSGFGYCKRAWLRSTASCVLGLGESPLFA